ncbi:hypothetical protein BH09DEP1_BH09DEP1_2690 [soil metagenome]
MYEYADNDKPAYVLPLEQLKTYISSARARFPTLSHSIYSRNAQHFTKAKYLIYLRHIFASHKLTIDFHVLKKIVEYVWMPQEIRISTKDALYLINGINIEWIKASFVINWDKSREKVEKAVLEKNITEVSIVSSAIFIDTLLQCKLVLLNPISKTYSFNESEIVLVPKPPLFPNWVPRVFKHIELQCNPGELKRIVRNHMGLLGIRETEK